MTEYIDAEGNKNTFSYNSLGQINKVTNAEGYSTVYTYDPNGNVIEMKEPKGGTTSFKYDALNRLIEVKDPLGAVTIYEYNVIGQVTKVVDSLGYVTTFAYDSTGRLLSTTDPMGNVTSYKYNSLNQIKEVIKPNGSIWKMNYDVLGNLTEAINPKSQTTHWEYNANGLVTLNRDPIGNETKYIYNALNQVEKIINAKGKEKNFTYTNRGQLQTVVDENNHTTIYEYDALNRLNQVTDALGYVTNYQYDGIGNLTVVHRQRQLPQETVELYLKTLEKMTNQTEAVTTEVYAQEISVSEQVYQEVLSVQEETVTEDVYRFFDNHDVDLSTYYRYDGRGLLTEIEDVTGQIIHYAYDENGNLNMVKERDGSETNYTYNIANRLTNIRYNDGKTINYSYNPLGQMTSMTDWLGTTSFEYDPLGRVTKVQDFANRITEYTWNTSNQKESIKYPDHSIVNYQYNELDQLTKVVDAYGKTTTYKYNPNGQVTERVLPNGSKTSMQYNKLNQIEQLNNLDPQNRLTERYKYTYDAAGNKILIEKQHHDEDLDDPQENETIEYRYDAINQLTQVNQTNGETRNYYYDSVGNRVGLLEYNQEEIVDGVYYKYNQLNQLVQTQDIKDQDIHNYTYDANGNLSKVASGGKEFTKYTFDATNHLAEVVNKHNQTTNYTYDGFGNRVQTKVNLNKPGNGRNDNGNHYGWENDNNSANPKTGWKHQFKREQMETNYVVDMMSPYNNVLMTYGDQWQVQRNTYGLELISMDFESLDDHDNGWVPNGTSTTYSGSKERLYYLQDELGSITKVIGENGKKAAHYNYDEFGRPLSAEKFDPNWPGPDNTFGYTGYQYDEYAGLYYAQARYYMPEIGRFISEDPWSGNLQEPNTMNPYPYVLNNPLKYTDPTGLIPIVGDNKVYRNGKVQDVRGPSYDVGNGYKGKDDRKNKKVSIKVDPDYLKELIITDVSYPIPEPKISIQEMPYGPAVQTPEVNKNWFDKAKDAVANTANDIYKNTTKFHFEDRDALNGQHPSYPEVMKRNSRWTLLDKSMSIYHDNGVGEPELKFVNPNGREAVFDGDTLQPVTDPRYKATYNYVTPAQPPENKLNVIGWGEFAGKGAGHFFTDMLPYYLTGSKNERNQDK